MKKLPPLPQTTASVCFIDIYIFLPFLSNGQLYFMDYIANLYVCSSLYNVVARDVRGKAH